MNAKAELVITDAGTGIGVRITAENGVKFHTVWFSNMVEATINEHIKSLSEWTGLPVVNIEDEVKSDRT